MKRFILAGFLIGTVAFLTGVSVLAQSGFDSGTSAINVPCWSSKPIVHVKDPAASRQQWTISFGLLESIMARGDTHANDTLTRIMTGPQTGELVAVFNVTEPNGFGGSKNVDLAGLPEFAQLNAVDRLTISEYGLISVPWTTILESGLPELPVESTMVTFVCKPLAEEVG